MTQLSYPDNFKNNDPQFFRNLNIQKSYSRYSANIRLNPFFTINNLINTYKNNLTMII